MVVSFSPVPRPQQAAEEGQQADGIGFHSAEAASPATEEEINELQEMFPCIEREVIQQVLEAERGDKDSTVNVLIEMAK